MELNHRQQSGIDYIHPEKELYAGIWTLYAGATAFLAARLWVKTTRRHGLWYDDYILIVCWIILTGNNIIITVEYATGYVTPTWDDRMRILIIISSCGTLLNQSLTKTAFAVTLLKLTRGFSTWKICHGILWFCIVSMCGFNFAKIVVEWGRVCNNSAYDKPFRLDFCLNAGDRSRFKEGGNYYNVIMDFIFALFPWVITWNLDMQRKEKIGLCLTMSLGMVVAIESAIRNEWKFQGNAEDRWYFWRNAMSNIWYSSEITGTIIVQCIPVLRPLVQEVKVSLRSKRLGSMTMDADESSGMPLDHMGSRDWYRPSQPHRFSSFWGLGAAASAAPERQR
ncbi:hypothetical protein CKM354_000143200 [Cercospora kikuchii]|uniref:Rhodopsin domain-containing protein n=1 Tax=Cercospora kikuchii TaxID=84275 RepID=A0A9P3CDH1_9PEZI|nr:uncharacterized protein CKM354_000143200 [Cercospora kikuchii]GIZ38005.1 hypothetical protein CKM354_000143200 [Cercospora kikuchii]